MPFIPRLESLGFSGIAYKENFENPYKTRKEGKTKIGETLRKFPPITPNVISIRATEMPVSTETRLPKKTSNPMMKAI
jgi:hypothetical protein